jgi:hypothetical protein
MAAIAGRVPSANQTWNATATALKAGACAGLQDPSQIA